jgi:hypothetical protein
VVVPDHRAAGSPATNSPHRRNESVLMSRRETGRISVGSWLGITGMALVGIAGGALALVAAGFVTFGSGSDTAAFVVFAGLTVIPSTMLWRNGNRYRRGTAIGLAVAFLSATFVVWGWHPWDTMSDEEVERAKAEVLASGHPAFYLGDEVEGYPLNEYFLGEGYADFRYGECHPVPNSEGECVPDIAIHNEWPDVRTGGDVIAGCVRQAAVAGVPTVHLEHEQLGFDNQVALFTGDSTVTIEVADSSLEEKLRIAREVRPVGAREAATSLAPPTSVMLSYVEKHCVPAR